MPSSSQRAKRRLIVNADDFGWTRGITDAILLAHRDGIVTSATLMVNQPASDYAIERARHAPELGLGIHLNLCEGRPVLPAEQVPSLVNADGRFFTMAETRQRLSRGQVRSAEIEAEFRAQIQCMTQRELIPTHADTHHNLHFHYRVAPAFRRALLAEGIRRIRTLRLIHRPRDGYWGGPRSGPLPRRLAVAAYMRLMRLFAYRGLASPDWCIDGHPRYGKDLALLAEGWKQAIIHMPGGTAELMCHPGVYEAGFSESDRLCGRRQAELRILTDPGFREVIQGSGIELIAYGQL